MLQAFKPRNSRTLGVFLLSALAGVGASAQTDGSTVLERQTNEAFQRVMQQPENSSLWTNYARLLIQAGNYEGGIAALERQLQDPASGPEVRVDLAVLYYRLGSYAMAETLAREALADQRLQGSNREFTQKLLSDVTRRNQRSQFSGSVVLGLRHQSNPLYRTDDTSVYASGALVPVTAGQTPQSDKDASLGARLRHVYDLELQNSATIVSNLSAFTVKYRSPSSGQLQATPTRAYDLVGYEFDTGVEFKPASDTLNGLTLRPYVKVADLRAQKEAYLSAAGGGLEAILRADEFTLYEVGFDAQRRNFADRIDNPNAAQLDGTLYTLRARIGREIASGQALSGDYVYRRNSSGSSLYDFSSHELRGTYSITYASLFANGQPWTTTAWAGATRRDYGAADATVLAGTTRADREWRLGLSQTIPLAQAWAFVLSVENARNDANLPNYKYRNTSVSGSVILNF